MFHYSKKWNARAPTCQALNEKIPNQRKNRLLTWKHGEKSHFLTFPACFSIPNFFSNLNSNCSNSLDLRNIQEQVKKAFCYQKLFWPFTVWINCSNDLKIFANSRPLASNFKSFSQSLEQFFLAVGQNNFGNKIPFRTTYVKHFSQSL